MKTIDFDYSEYAGQTISIAEAKSLTKNYSKDDIEALIRMGEVPGCVYTRKEGKERGHFIISKPHWLAFIAGRIYKEKTSVPSDQTEADV